MLKLSHKFAVAGLAACMALPALASQAAPPREGGVDVEVNNQGAKVQVQRDDSAKEQAATRQVKEGTRLGAYRSSDLLSMSVKNAEGKDLGKINDIVIATNNGKVRYAALSFGGFLGLGDKMFALPWDALRLKKTDDSTYFVLNVTKDKLENAPGFDQDNWPNFADSQMTRKLDAYYGVEKQSGKDRRLLDRDNTDRPNLRERIKERRNPAETANDSQPNASAYATTYRVSEVKALQVNDSEGENIASIEDLVIDIDQGNVRYVAVSFDDSWGYGEKLFAMPWKALNFQHQDDQTTIVLNVDQAQMKQATGFENDDWPNFADKEWRNKTDKFYLNVPGAEVEVE